MRKKAVLLDVSYVVKNNTTYISLLVKGKTKTTLLYRYSPYFLVDAPEDRIEDLLNIEIDNKGEKISPYKAELIEKKIKGRTKSLIKLYCNAPSHVPILRANIPFPCYEYSIPFTRRFLYDHQISPFDVIVYEREGRFIKRFVKKIAKPFELSILSFDIEVYDKEGVPQPDRDPVLMISYVNEEKKEVLTYRPSDKAIVLNGEYEMFEQFRETVEKCDPDIIVGYNSSMFDLPYLKERSRLIGCENFTLSRHDKPMKPVKRGLINGFELKGRIHFDLYPVMRLFGQIGIIKTENYTLDSVSESVLGENKIELEKRIFEFWDSGEINSLSEYCLKDALLTYRLAEDYLPLEVELSQTAKLPLFQTTLATSGQMVESLLMFNASRREEVIPLKPSSSLIAERLANPIKGAFVKLPAPGIYSNIAVLDFRGLYPSIIVSYNIDPNTLVDSGEDVFNSPTGAKFRKDYKGLVPEVLEYLIDKRSEIKHRLKSLDPDSPEYKTLSARSQALKILANSFYGYLGYARSRWYSRDCAESVTAWGRKHISETISKAQKKGFEVLYADTDSLFLLYSSEQEVLDFMKEINQELPEKMELELEGFYVRGVFVSKKSEEKGAKKKYALLGKDGRIKIRGFELVRRDWSEIAKETQRKVLEIILKEGSKEKAAKIVRKVIKDLKEGKVPLEKLAIKTQLKKAPDKYEVKSPELNAAILLKNEGQNIGKGTIISYVISKKGTSISEKSVPLSLAKNYDAEYYIKNQILPSVMKIMKELGYDEYSLIKGGKQQSLEEFF